MKAKLEIPNGWRRLKVGELVKVGDRQLNIDECAFVGDCVFSWNVLTSYYLSCFIEPLKATRYDYSQIIRKVKK